MDANAAFLNEIYENARMGEETLGVLLRYAEAGDFAGEMQDERRRFTGFMDKARDQLRKAGEEPHDSAALGRGWAKLMTGAKAMRDPSASRMAEMLIEGNTAGVTDMTRLLAADEGLDPGVRALGHALKTFELQNIQNCRRYL